MKLRSKQLLVLILIIGIAVFMRFFRLDSAPSGFQQDEISQAYNSFSLINTGHDRYGQYLPILFRSFGSYQPPVYTYVSTIPILLLGNTVFAARFLSAFAGVVVVIATYFILLTWTEEKHKHAPAMFSAFMVAISPWAIHFSRRSIEANLGLAFFLIAILLLIKSLKNIKLFPLAMLVLGISTQAYYSERVIGLLFITVFLFIYRQIFLGNKKTVILGFIIFAVTQIPHLWILSTGAYARRFAQVSYFNNDPGNLPRALYIMREFVRHFLSYISPKNLFSLTEEGLGQVAPDQGVLFSWMFIPFLFGLKKLVHTFKGDSLQGPALLVLLLPISIIPAALTGNEFYPFRAMEFMWCITVLIGLGMYMIFSRIKNNYAKFIIISVLTLYSFSMFYVSYFILLRHEKIEYTAAAYVEMDKLLKQYQYDKVIVDSTRDLAVGLRIAYLNSYDPDMMSKDLASQLTTGYYSADVPTDEVYRIGNIEARPIFWRDDPCIQNTIIVGDELAVSADQAREHGLTKLFEIESSGEGVVLRGYSTNPPKRCIP